MPEPRRRRAANDEKRRSRSRPDSAQSRGPDHDETEPREAASNSRKPRPVGQIVQAARDQLEELIGRPVSATLGLERQDEGWQLTVEVVELERIPDTTSILGCYRALVNHDGELLEYRRIRRYSRSQADEDI